MVDSCPACCRLWFSCMPWQGDLNDIFVMCPVHYLIGGFESLASRLAGCTFDTATTLSSHIDPSLPDPLPPIFLGSPPPLRPRHTCHAGASAGSAVLLVLGEQLLPPQGGRRLLLHNLVGWPTASHRGRSHGGQLHAPGGPPSPTHFPPISRRRPCSCTYSWTSLQVPLIGSVCCF